MQAQTITLRTDLTGMRTLTLRVDGEFLAADESDACFAVSLSGVVIAFRGCVDPMLLNLQGATTHTLERDSRTTVFVIAGDSAIVANFTNGCIPVGAPMIVSRTDARSIYHALVGDGYRAPWCHKSGQTYQEWLAAA